ncbi:MAG: hypothetical protein ABI024_07025 [Vicinamibacterales bacterium]
MMPPLRLERLRALARHAAGVAGAALVAFHGWLFAAQAAQGRFEDPWLVFRWLVAVGLVAALAAVRRAGGSICTRQGLGVWVLAALLHGPAVPSDFGNSIDLALPETVATSILQSLMSISALTATLWLLAGLLGLREPHTRLHVSGVAAHSHGGFFGDGFTPHYSSRPPPQPN